MTKKLNRPIYVTQPALPPLEEFADYLRQIWDSKILTNNGPFHQQFEEELAEYLGVKYLSVFSNGTLALVTALQALRITGEVITTPFSFVATTHSLWWNNIKPVFVDIEPEYFNLDPEKIESAITPQTTAIMPVHVYGNPCNVDKIQRIADTYGLKVIYDAAHAFGVTVNGNSILNYGDLSILSFHATKTFNTIEGGAIICHDKKTKQRIDFLKNFGFADEVTVVAPGINAKMNELQAAYGLVQLKHVDEYIDKRKSIAGIYRNMLNNVNGLRMLNDIPGVRHSYTYFPVLFEEKSYGVTRDEVYEMLRRNNINGRRYFYPLISQFPTYRGLASAKPENLSIGSLIANQVICLPIYPDLEEKYVIQLCKLLTKK
ncbi:MAG: DegT/DnrJ/EryC1/StrS family aminotransferase [Bacteroidales bacterium]|jgi:dTDP-4-amino-4,6-dideoxygalactose transaminase|nr:DegT/DnrJ/EryC1/StrS family aminotransferase [Bacteroidales bacterium]